MNKEKNFYIEKKCELCLLIYTTEKFLIKKISVFLNNIIFLPIGILIINVFYEDCHS